MAELIKMPFRELTPVGPRNHALDEPNTPGKGAILLDISQSIINKKEHPVSSRYSQPYLVGGSNDAVFC